MRRAKDLMSAEVAATKRPRREYTIRLAELGDLDAARALMIRTFEEDFVYGFRPEFHADVQDLQGVYLDHPRNLLVVAVAPTGEIVGTAGIRSGGLKPEFNPDWLVARYDPARTAQIVRVYTLREWRGCGVARALVMRAVAGVPELGGYDVVALHTDPRSSGAERFWRSMPTTLIYDDRDGPSESLHFEMVAG